MPGTLIFFTSGFPYGSGETFIENELPFLAAAFNRVIIVTTDTTGNNSREVPENAEIIRISEHVSWVYKLKALSHFFSATIQEETGFIKKRLNLSVTSPILPAMLGGYARALFISDTIKNIIAQHNLSAGQVVLYSYWMSNTAAGLALYKSENPGTKAYCRAHGWDVYFERHQPPYLPLRNFIINGLDGCCCISQNGMEYFENLLGENVKKHLQLSRLGTFNKTGKRSQRNDNKLVIISCSNIIPLKRVHLIIEALALIKDIAIEWTHFGRGSMEEEIKVLAQEKLAGAANIKYEFAGQVSNGQLLDYYASHNIDLFINLSETEGLPVSFMEAGSYGIPVIATHVGGTGEIIKDGVNGFLIDADSNPGGIARKVRAYYGLPQQNKEMMRENAFNEWQRKYNAEVNYQDFIKILKKPI